MCVCGCVFEHTAASVYVNRLQLARTGRTRHEKNIHENTPPPHPPPSINYHNYQQPPPLHTRRADAAAAPRQTPGPRERERERGDDHPRTATQSHVSAQDTISAASQQHIRTQRRRVAAVHDPDPDSRAVDCHRELRRRR